MKWTILLKRLKSLRLDKYSDEVPETLYTSRHHTYFPLGVGVAIHYPGLAYSSTQHTVLAARHRVRDVPKTYMLGWGSQLDQD